MPSVTSNARPADAIVEGDPLPPDDRVAPHEMGGIEDLYRAQSARLLRFFARRTNRDTARDLVQQAFVRLLGAAARDRSVQCPEAYLQQTANNLLRDEARTLSRRSTARHVSSDDVSLVAPDLVTALEARDMLCRLERAMLRLKPKTREIFLAHRLDGYSYAEIAARTGMTTKAVEMQMSRAIAQLDRYLSAR